MEERLGEMRKERGLRKGTTVQWSRNEFHVGGAIFIFLVVYNFSANKACRR